MFVVGSVGCGLKAEHGNIMDVQKKKKNTPPPPPPPTAKNDNKINQKEI